MKKSRINMLNKSIVGMGILWSAFLCFGYTQSTILTDQTGYSFTMPDYDLELMATSEPKSGISYVVNYYQEDLSGGYQIYESLVKTGITDMQTQAEDLGYTGFTVKPFSQTGIAGDESSHVDIYYDRNVYTIVFDSDGGSEVPSITGKYDSLLTAPSNPEKGGYRFGGRNPAFPERMPVDGANLKASWNIISSPGGHSSAVVPDPEPATGDQDTITGDVHGSPERECSIAGSEFTDELNGAYQYACSVGITTMEPIQNANMVGPLLRKHLAKMVSEFAMNELGMDPDKEKVCKFDDMSGESKEMQKYAEIACQLGFMGLHSDGVQVKDNFDPNDQVIRAEFGTVLSRLLWGTKYATDDGDLFYKYHLEALKENGIMTQIYGDWPYSVELRGYVMLMLMRVSGLKGTETWSDIVQSEIGNIDTGDNAGIGGDAKVDEGNMHVSFVGFRNGVMTTTGDYIHIVGALDPSQKVVSVRVTHRDTKGKSKITKYKLSKYEAATHYFWFNASVVNKSLTLKDKNTYEFEFYDAKDKLLFKKSVVIIQK